MKDLILESIKNGISEIEENIPLRLPDEEKLECRVEFKNLYEDYKRIALEHLNNVEVRFTFLFETFRQTLIC